ncbi:putative Radical SAM superfamily protein [Blattamonas nauphoetae]|uniref:Radical SAM superfamily protein n=1 Tax=Blattamonas nauphoetae TaxID=2049346 RepID=A0ABQ9YA30_9EUKA|nr:putative Radical SAM superfamily protein [Blattamonas nauphoetae]
MIYFVYCTTGCNLHCTYCGNDPEEMCMPLLPQYSVEELQAFIERDFKASGGAKPTLVLYGGEPLVNFRFVEQLLDTIDATFILQTNACFLEKLSKKHIERFASILVSIDGPEEVVDRRRGAGTYQKCTDGVVAALRKGTPRNLVARGTAMEGNDIYASVMHLLNHPTIPFTHTYWQLNVGFDAPMRTEFEDWVKTSYNPGITRLINEWVGLMETEGKVLGIVPFLSQIETMLQDEERGSINLKELRPIRCGVGYNTFTITTDAKIGGCPCGIGEKWNYLSTDFRTIENPVESLCNRLKPKDPCTDCENAHYCGGRCLYCNVTRYWQDEYKRVVCDLTVTHLINEVKRVFPKVKELLTSGRIQREPFQYPAEDYSLEVIP